MKSVKTIYAVGCAVVAYAVGYWFGLNHWHPKPVTEAFHPATQTVEVPQSPDMERLDARIDQLRVREIEGGIFEQLALDYIKGGVNLDRQIAAAKQSAKIVTEGRSDYDKQVINKAVENFESKINAVRTPKP